MADKWKQTLHLPQTDFPMRANLATRELEFLKLWQSMDLQQKMIQQNEQGPSFSFHDGPPYANGEIHIGHALNKILKDLIVKYRSLRGYKTHYIPGWDTHGLPIELTVLKSEGIDKDAIDPVTLRKKCTKAAYKWMEKQRESMKRLGCQCDWDHPYMTLQKEFEARELETLADMVEKGLVYRGGKPVYWCIDCQTALAAAEIEYADVKSTSVFVAYQLPELSSFHEALKGKDCNVVIWTTTPWTLPASMAVALGRNYDYGFYPEGEKVYLFACGMKDQVAADLGKTFGEPLLVVKGSELEGLKAQHPFLERELPLVLADYVTLDAGTGCVHTAPGHGVDDYETGIRYGIEIYNPVDNKGTYVSGTPLVGGLSIEEGGKRILSVLSESGRLLAAKKIEHSYPHCWRCHHPVIFRTTDQWFLDVEAFREKTLNMIDNDVRWIPAWGHDRIYNMVKERSDWCLSRQRVWGVPIPAFHCDACGETVLDAERVRHVADVVRQEGSDAWFSKDTVELMGPELCKCPKCGALLEKGKDILDVWFDSGCSHFSVLEEREGQEWPADLYLEGADQHRGWFQTSLLTSVATKEKAPYKSVLTHGFIVDGEGRKMSKSLGNGVDPKDVIQKSGADILRLWVASTDYRQDIRISDTILDGISDNYRRLRNTLRFLLGNLADFDPSVHMVATEHLSEFDRWALARLQQVVEKATEGFESYEFHVPSQVVHSFCVTDLSAIYLDVSKDRLYSNAADELSRRSCQTVMWEILTTLTRLLSPVLSFTAEETWQQIRKFDSALPESVFLSGWPVVKTELLDHKLLDNWEKILQVRASIMKALEGARAQGEIGQSLEAKVQVVMPESMTKCLTETEWADLCIVSQFEHVADLGLEADANQVQVKVLHAEGTKCPRCWKYEATTDSEGLCSRCRSVVDSL